VNRDGNGQAQGSLLIDDGLNRTKIEETGEFSYFKFQYSANSLKKFKSGGNGVNDKANMNQYLDKLIIANAEDLMSVDFACSVDFNQNVKSLFFQANKPAKTLTITPETKDTINLEDLRDIYFGDSSKDINYCDAAFFQYAVEGDAPDLTKSTANFTIAPKKGSLPKLKVTLTKLMDGLRVNITYADEKLKQPFNPYVANGWKYAPADSKLSDNIDIRKDPFSFAIKDSKGMTIYDT